MRLLPVSRPLSNKLAIRVPRPVPPIGTIEEFALKNNVHLWSKQREVVELFQTSRQTAIRSGHGVGKSFLSALITLHWVLTHPLDEVGVMIVAPSWAQIKSGVLQELRRLHEVVQAPGEVTATRWMWEGREVVTCRSPPEPADGVEQRIQGVHRRFLLVILEEGCGIQNAIWSGAMSCASGLKNKVLTIGNPTVPESRFADAFAPDSGWATGHISCHDSPNVTGEDVPDVVKESVITQEAIDSLDQSCNSEAERQARVFGEFPTVSQLSFFTPKNIENINKCDHMTLSDFLRNKLLGPLHLGADPSRGIDEFAVWGRRGDKIAKIPKEAFAHNIDPSDTRLMGVALAQFAQQYQVSSLFIDSFGVGADTATAAAGVYPGVTVPVNTGDPASDRHDIFNCRSELHAHLKSVLESPVSVISSDTQYESLRTQLKAVRVDLNDRRLKVESKELVNRRIGRSPDDADAVMLTYTHEARGNQFWCVVA